MTDPTATVAGFDVRYTPEHGQPRTIVFVPRETNANTDTNTDAKMDDRWLRAEFEWTGTDWRQVGAEPVTGVAVFDEDCELTTPEREALLGADSRGADASGTDDQGTDDPDRDQREGSDR